MFFIGLGTATPPHCYTQHECWDAMHRSALFSQLAPRSRAILKKVFLSNNGIVTRHLALSPLEEGLDITPATLQARFAKHAPLLAAQAVEAALRDGATDATEVDAILVSTCTGYLCPGLSGYVSERLGLRPDVLGLDLVGHGCGAALPNLRTAEALLKAGRARRILSVCVEVCSAAIYFDDDPGVLISACLFGDAAAAALLSAEPLPKRRPVEWKRAQSLLVPSARDLLRFEQRDGLLRNILTPSVPALASTHAEEVFNQLMSQAGLTASQIRSWIWHAGGRDVLLALRDKFQLHDSDLQWSGSVLRDLGNVSSPFVLHALQRALQGGAPDGWWWMSSFGAGFSCHGALLHVG
jgi:alkylresorcinol/alkylpyrone synthase